jgi:protein-S-isoprenylcysteine O-methyltransferase Ste14
MIYRWRVRAGTLAMIAVCILAQPNLHSHLLGLAVAACGLLIRAWAAGHLIKEKTLAVSGPYRHTRNPLYLGNLIIGIGIVVSSRSVWVLAVFALYFMVFYPVIILRERDRMKTLFPEKYAEYKSIVPLFFPSFRRQASSEEKAFSWDLYKKNREYRALTGASLFWLLLSVKILLGSRLPF